MIEFVAIRDHGNLDRERVVFRATEAGDVGDYMVYCARSIVKNDGKRQLRNTIFSTYWFINKEVNEGDILVLYTKDPGVNYKFKPGREVGITHFFYWKSEDTLWDRGDVALVFGKLATYQTHFPEISTDDLEP
ncbi:MAG: hypothetical protein M3177_02540 [Pseudomonadota bacterium]|nr:hypothetical protein [Pseudomonadota bacterium]